jgi:hypothetical protein
MEVGKMPAQRKTNQSRGLTAAGLITVTAATLLMMAWAIFPTRALADQSISIDNGSLSSHGCDDTEWHFIITGLTDQNNNGSNDDEAPATIHVTWANGASADVSVAHTPGGTAHYHTTANLDSTVTGATAVIYDGWDGVFTLSHGPCETTTTTTTTTTPTTTTTTPTTTTTTPTTTTTTPTTTTTTPTTTTTTPTTTTTTPTTTTTTPGGGGGGGTTTTPPASTTPTTTPPIVAPTTVHNTSTTATAEVLPTTVRPGKLAFTGIEDVVPIGALALTLMTTGSGLLWAGSRRRRHDGSEDED